MTTLEAGAGAGAGARFSNLSIFAALACLPDQLSNQFSFEHDDDSYTQSVGKNKNDIAAGQKKKKIPFQITVSTTSKQIGKTFTR